MENPKIETLNPKQTQNPNLKFLLSGSYLRIRVLCLGFV